MRRTYDVVSPDSARGEDVPTGGHTEPSPRRKSGAGTQPFFKPDQRETIQALLSACTQVNDAFGTFLVDDHDPDNFDRLNRAVQTMNQTRLLATTALASSIPVVHYLKTHPEPYALVVKGIKRFEVRKFDRPFKIGDELVLQEFEPSDATYTGQQIRMRIDTMVAPGEYGLGSDVGVLGISPLE